jgi:hypothetical protein
MAESQRETAEWVISTRSNRKQNEIQAGLIAAVLAVDDTLKNIRSALIAINNNLAEARRVPNVWPRPEDPDPVDEDYPK